MKSRENGAIIAQCIVESNSRAEYSAVTRDGASPIIRSYIHDDEGPRTRLKGKNGLPLLRSVAF